MPRHPLYTALISIAALTFATALHASETANIGATETENAIPHDAAFVRLLCGKESQLTFAVGTTIIGKCEGAKIHPYFIVLDGKYHARAGAERFTVHLKAGEYYSLALRPGGRLSWLEDQHFSNPNKAYLHYYNLSTAPQTTLQASNHGVDIFTDVYPGERQASEMNALNVALAATSQGKPIATLPPYTLMNEEAVDVVLVGTGTEDDPYTLLFGEQKVSVSKPPPAVNAP